MDDYRAAIPRFPELRALCDFAPLRYPPASAIRRRVLEQIARRFAFSLRRPGALLDGG